MLIRSELWGLSLLGALGLVPTACSGKTERGSSASGGENGSGAESGRDGGASGRGGTSASGQGAFSGSGQGGESGEGGGGHGGTRSPTSACTSAREQTESGIVHCGPAEGFFHRPRIGPGCTYEPNAEGGAAGAAGAAGASAFEGSSEAGGASGVCEPSKCPGPLARCERDDFAEGASCAHGCLVDSDCGPAAICECSGDPSVPGHCLAATCRSDGDCGAGLLCAGIYQTCGGVAFACQTLHDECLVDGDCGDDRCVNEHQRFECSSVVCGRPFLVESAARVAKLEPRNDYLEPKLALPDAQALEAEERDELARHYARLGQLEHASIAAFARFQLQLLGLGAPLELSMACQQALLDETAHAQGCFTLASFYAGRGVGAGRLAVDDCLSALDLGQVLRLVVLEGCVGETVAALEAAETAERAQDPAVRALFTRIAADERRHAELAFRFVQWGLARQPELRAVVWGAWREACEPRAYENESVAVSDSVIAHGLLPSALRAEVRERALAHAVAPALCALLAAAVTACAA